MKKYNRFSGDPAIKITENGAKMEFIGGQPVMDQGIENAVMISLFTKSGWWGNTLESEESKKIGSEFETESNKTIVELASINRITDACKKSLKWMTDTKLAGNIDITVTNPKNDFIKTEIKIDSMILLFLKNGLNWIAQATNPAHDRFRSI